MAEMIDDTHHGMDMESKNIETPRLIGFLSELLEGAADANDRRQERAAKMTAFHGVTRPAISIGSYLERIFRYANCSESCFLVAYVYLDRLSQAQPVIGAVDSFNVHRLLITSVLLAAKFMDDMYYNNAYYAKIGGISTVEMNFLEVEFLFGLGFHLNVSPSAFHDYTSYLHRQMSMIQPRLSTKSLALISSSSGAPIIPDDHHRHQSCFVSSGGVDHQDEASSSSRQLQHQQLAV